MLSPSAGTTPRTINLRQLSTPEDLLTTRTTVRAPVKKLNRCSRRADNVAERPPPPPRTPRPAIVHRKRVRLESSCRLLRQSNRRQNVVTPICSSTTRGESVADPVPCLRFEKSLYDLIRGLRNHKGNEREYIQESLRECRKEIKGSDMG